MKFKINIIYGLFLCFNVTQPKGQSYMIESHKCSPYV